MQPLDPQLFEPNTDRNSLLLFIQGLFLLVWFIPATPICIGGLALLGLCPIPRPLAVFLAISSVVIGLLLTLASGVLALSSDTQLLHGISLTIAIASSFLIWSGRDGKPNPSWIAKIGISISTLIAFWSLLTIPMLLLQARLITDGSPYCIAEHSENSPIEALHGLRGFSFYTTKTGYKSTSEWYFHGLMIVDHPDDQRVYNWSPRHWRFDLVERPDAPIEPVRNVCVPK